MSILAGIVISIGCICYLQVGGVVGSLLFSVGLMSVILYQFKLFTGQAGKLATRQIKVINLIGIWFGNAAGALLMAAACLSRQNLIDSAAAIVAARTAIGPFWMIILSIPCGMLMFMAVNVKNDSLRLFYAMLCVAAFINGGFYHCVADMFYTFLAGTLNQYVNILYVTIGNVIGCNVIPLTKAFAAHIQEVHPKLRC